MMTTLIVLKIILCALIFILGFLIGSIYELSTSTRNALNGWQDTLDEWKKQIEKLKALK